MTGGRTQGTTRGAVSKSVILRASARRDVEETVVHYLEESGGGTAIGFIDAVEGALEHLARNPGSGSPRHGHDLHLGGLRSWPLMAYPYIIFYMEGEGVIDVWRILHGRRDIPRSLRADR